LEELLTKYGDIFAMNSNGYRQTNSMYKRIDIGEAQPIHQHLRRLPLAKQADMGEMLQDMQRHGVIKESYSPWSSPIILVRKNGSLHFHIDYRKVNDVTRKGCFPLSQIDDTVYTGWSQTVLHSLPE
jgi:hypothetical protein